MHDLLNNYFDGHIPTCLFHLIIDAIIHNQMVMKFPSKITS